MNINYNSKNIQISDEMKDYFEKRIERITKYEHLINSVDVYFSIDKYINQVEVIIDFRKGKTVCFTGQDNDMYKAIDDVIDRIEKNVNKYKDKITNHKEVEPFKMIELKYKTSETNQENIETIDLNKLYKKPLAIEDAVFLLEKEKDKNYMFFYNYENVESDDLAINFLVNFNDKYYVFEKNNNSNKIKKKVLKKEKNLKLIEEKILDIREDDIDNALKEIKEKEYDILLDKNTKRLIFLIKNKEKYVCCYL